MLVKAKLSQPYPSPYCTQIIDKKILKMTLTNINRELHDFIDGSLGELDIQIQIGWRIFLFVHYYTQWPNQQTNNK